MSKSRVHGRFRLMKWIFLLFLVLTTSCRDKTVPDEEEIAASNRIERPVIEVKTAIAHKGNFENQNLAQGYVRSIRNGKVVWRAEGIVETINVKEGDYIKKGELLGSLSNQEQLWERRDLEIQLEEAKMRRADLIITSGLDSVNYNTESPKWNWINLKSGYRGIQLKLEKLNNSLGANNLYAPFSGVVLDLQATPGDLANKGSIFCTLLGTSNFQLEFYVLESFALQLKTGQRVKFSSVASPALTGTGRIKKILPLVNNDGLVAIISSIDKQSPKLMDNMKLSIEVPVSLPNQIIVPKEAVVLRSGKAVVFVYEPQTRRAKWKYVEIAAENLTDVAISKGIEEGDEVIVEGNLNLSHDAEVIVVQDNPKN